MPVSSGFGPSFAEGAPTEEALKGVYSKSLTEFDEDARQWYKQSQYPVEYFRSPSEPTTLATVRTIPELDVELTKATISGSDARKGREKSGYRRLTQMAGDQCEHQAALGDLAYASHLFTEASLHYQKAIKCGVNASALAKGLESALVDRDGVPVEELESVIALTGGVRSRYLLGVARFFSKDYEATLHALADVSGLPQAERFRAIRIKAVTLAKLSRYSEARVEAEKLISSAKDSDQRQSADLTLQDIERDRQLAEAPPLQPHEILLRGLTRLDGEVIRVDCMGQRARFWVQVGSENKKLIIADPSEIVSGGEMAAQLEFKCGTQKRAVTIGYNEHHDPGTDTVGRIKYIQFR